MSTTAMDTTPSPNTPFDDVSTTEPSRQPVGQPTSKEAPREGFLSPFAQIFLGPEGPHAGTRWLIYLALAFATLSVFNSFFYSLQSYLNNSLWFRMGAELSMLLAAILPGFLMARLEGCRFGDFGLPGKFAFGRNFWLGALWGLSSLTVLMLVLRMLGAFSFGTFAHHGARVLKLGLFWAAFFLCAALFEDFLTRGYSQWVLTKGMNFWPAAAVLSLLFGAIHLRNPGETSIGITGVVAIGLFFCLTLWRTGNLWWAVGFHAAWDWGESFLYSVPDSGSMAPGHLLNSSLTGPDWLTGGLAGPEGSYLVFVLLAVLWILFSRVYPDVKYGAQPQNYEMQAANSPE